MSQKQGSSTPINAFIVRFWREVEAGRVRWGGRVQHIQSREQAAFVDEAGLLAFVRRWIQMPHGAEENRREDREGG